MRAALSAILLAVALLVPAAHAQAPSDAPPAERPTYQVGDRWIRTDGAYDLVRIESDQYVFAAGSGREIRLTRDLAFASVRRGSATWAFEPPAKVEWPLVVGKSGIARGAWKGPHAPDGLPAQISWRVVGVEPVTVAGVTLQAYVVGFAAIPEGAAHSRGPGQARVGSGRGGGGGGGGGGVGGGGAGQGSGRFMIGFRAWYAPEAKQWVKAESPLEWARFEAVAFDHPPRVAATPAPAPMPPGPTGPLTIEVRFPKENAHVTDEASVIVALVNSGKGLGKVTVTVNGVEVSQENQRGLQRSLQVGTPVTLRPGANAIVVSATEPGGAARQETRTVYYDPPQVAAVAPGEGPAPPRPVLRNQWAVIVGVGNYENATIPRLKYTVADAEALSQTLVSVGFKKENVLLLTDRADKKPTLRNIKWALGTFLGRSAQKEDTVLIFFAGHGAPEPDKTGSEKDGLAKYLIPGDADPDDLYSTALPMDELQTIFSRIEAERVVVFLDACYSGGAGGRTFSMKSTRGTLNDEFLERVARSKGRAIVTASRTNEVSLELPALGHGIFTYYLVEGLKGAAADRDGIVTVQDLYKYVEQQVTKKSMAVGGNQHPVMKGEFEGPLPLARVKASK